MLTVHADRIEPQAWRNGGGRTRELLARPAGADWKLRVSLADIEADGPFSAFPGVQRWFAVVQGAGMVLSFADGQRRMQAGDAPLCFDGGEAPGCSLTDGPTRDLNLMVRGGMGAMRPVEAGRVWTERFAERGLFTLCAGHWHSGDAPAGGENLRPSPEIRVEPHTLLWGLGDPPCCFVPDVDGPCGWWLGYSENAA